MTIYRGDVWWVDFGEGLPGRPADLRPAVIVSRDAFNASAALTVTVVPGTTRQRSHPMHVVAGSAETGLPKPTAFQPELVTTIGKTQLQERAGRVGQITMRTLTIRLASFLELD